MTKAEKTRQFIIEKTAPLFNKRGYFGTTMSEITQVTGLTKGSVYGNFENKDELAIEAFKYNRFLLTNEISQILQTKNNTIDKLLVFTKFYRDNMMQVFSRGGCALLNTGVDSDDGHPALKEEVKKALLSWKELLQTILNNGLKKNEIKEVKPQEFSGFFMALIEGSIFLSKTLGSTSHMNQNLDYLEKEILKLKA